MGCWLLRLYACTDQPWYYKQLQQIQLLRVRIKRTQPSQMRSLIKMQVSKYPIFDVVPINELPFQQEEVKCSGVATHTSMKNNLKRNALYGINTSGRNSSVANQIIIEGCSVEEKKKQGDKKRSIEKYISDLTTQIQNPLSEPDFGETKFKVLKRIIEHYDIKTMEKNHYSKLIKTFGLQIEPVKTERKQVKTQNQNRSFKIKSTTRGQSRLSSLKNRISSKEDGEVALLEFSKELKPATKHSVFRQKKIASEEITERYKEKFRVNVSSKQKQRQQGSPNKKMSPFKFRSTQDILVEKINKFREFLFVLNCSNHLYRPMQLENYPKTIKFYIGPGNNSNLIKSLLKKRFYFQEINNIQQANFIWTQIKQDQIFNAQSNSHLDWLPRRNRILDKREIRFKNSNQADIQGNLMKIVTKDETHFAMKISEQLSRKSACFGFEERLKLYGQKFNISEIQQTDKVHNHLPSNGLLGNKKGMFYCLRQFYKIRGKNVWDILPLTFHISKGILDNEFKQFSNYYSDRKKNKLPNIWIMKPGEFSNRGNGINCSNKMDEIRKRASKCHVGKNGQAKTLILQLYISNPLLYNNRKFDIRAYMLVTCHNGKFKGYWYQEGYIRTSSYTFDLGELADNDIHLTNDAIQKKTDTYGKYQPGNKLSYAELQRYLDGLTPNGRNMDFYANSLCKMKEIAAQSLMSSFMFLDENKKENNFEIFGLDFMLDYNLKPWLIEINTNPCLELSCPLLERIIPHMVENAFRICLDPIFPPPDHVPHNFKYNIAENALYYNRFELIFDEDRDGREIKELYEAYPGSSALVSSLMNIKEDQEVYKEEGILCDYDI